MPTLSRLAVAAAASLLVLAAACDRSVTPPPDARAPSRIVYGSPDGSAHPAVVLVVMDVAGQPRYSCSGTLIAPRRVLTAGHCVGEPGEFSGMRVFTESDVLHGTNSFPYAGANTIAATAWHAHPDFAQATYWMHDVGVIELAAPVTLPATAYGQLPSANQLDALRPGRATTFTAVGYGLQRINPAHIVAEPVRRYAEPYLLQINTPFTGPGLLMLSNNASSGGSCFGDSGGPNYIGSTNTIGALTSFGLNENCAGTGMVFRLDRADVLSFVQQYLGS